MKKKKRRGGSGKLTVSFVEFLVVQALEVEGCSDPMGEIYLRIDISMEIPMKQTTPLFLLKGFLISPIQDKRQEMSYTCYATTCFT
jgi:hypothetical protein